MTSLEHRVMASVRVIWIARSLISPLALKVYALVFSFAATAAFVSVADVAANAVHVFSQGGPAGMAGYTIAAVLGTRLIVQLALILGTLALASLFAPVLRISGARRLFA